MNSLHESWAEAIRALNLIAPEVAPRTGFAVPLSRRNVRKRDIDENGRLKFRPTFLFFFVLLALCSGLNSSWAADVTPSEAQLKAAFLLNFPKYVDWPPSDFPQPDGPIVVGIFGGENVVAEFSTMSEGKIVEGHPVKFVRVITIPQCRECHILFVGSSESRKMPEILSSLKGANVLTVGESDQFIEQGGMINLARRDRRIALEVNLEATRQTQLKISSKLMALATVKGGKK
jgi:hypothetical protein